MATKIGRPHKGNRHVQTTRIPTEILATLDQVVARLGYDSRSALIADLVVSAMGRGDLVEIREFDVMARERLQEGLPLAI
jgi:metal-responsive CopG/Arc/MetJ family transcriptional regulator